MCTKFRFEFLGLKKYFDNENSFLKIYKSAKNAYSLTTFLISKICIDLRKNLFLDNIFLS